MKKFLKNLALVWLVVLLIATCVEIALLLPPAWSLVFSALCLSVSIAALLSM